MAILTVENLYKNYGPIEALKGVSFSVPKGSVFGILGPNGSGKTTLLGIILDVLRATSGSYKLFDQAPTHVQRQQIGTLLETPNFYHYLNAVQNLTIAAAIKQRGKADIDKVLQLVNLEQRRFSKFSTYSLGMKQRLAIASSLLGDPDVLVFDEPTNGLDPVGIVEIRELIKKLSKEGKTIIMASHLLDEVEKVCTHVAVLQKGTLLTHGHVDEILVTEDIVETGATDLQQLHTILEQYPGVKGVHMKGQHVDVAFSAGTAHLEALNRFCFDKGITLNHLRLRKKSLETKFFELTQNNN
ncbi:ABC transporter ATP-binding protein [Niastella populi]|uniref:ABC transporter ATP-binding protein n=1 Tax=Niastella populi TaxID=550983 RepID=A0A1V9F671_9BACT|nr:ABC transporter ATP-binding protein [Niastella populi]OQP53706.1 ABC transporter ATP-binding protein [Niastella populi]